MRVLYDILLTLAVLLNAPFFMLKLWRRGNWRQGFRQRFGRYGSKVKQAITNRHVLWLHAVSVGEVGLVIRLIDEIHRRLPNLKIVVSTTTTTGMGELRKRVPAHIEKIYYPIDRRKWVQRALGTIHPEAIVLVEAEIWPNFLWRAQEMGVPTFLVNARISERSHRGYRRLGGIFRALFGGLSRVCCATEEDARRLREIGCRDDAVRVVGNLKWDTALGGGPTIDARAVLNQLGVPEDAPVLLGGSTHDGEEVILAETWQQLRGRFPGLFLVLVPRHHERAREAGGALRARGLRVAFRTDLQRGRVPAPGATDCLMVNTTGELRSFYEIATVVFVGKTLTADGGQNPIEPAALGRAVVFGPNMQNFPAIVPEFLKADAVRQVSDAGELTRVVGDLLADPKARNELGLRAKTVVEANLGAISRTVEVIAERLRSEEIYVTEASDGPAGSRVKNSGS